MKSKNKTFVGQVYQKKTNLDENADWLRRKPEKKHRKGYLTKFMEKATVGNAFFTLVSIVKLIFRSPRPLNLLGKPGAKKTFHQYRMNKLGKIRYVHLLYFNFVKVRGGACL